MPTQLYAVKDDNQGDDCRNKIRSWWVHFTVAVAVSAVALVVLVIHETAGPLMPHRFVYVIAIAAFISWPLSYTKRAETRAAEEAERWRTERRADFAAMSGLIAGMQAEQAELVRLLKERGGFAEDWLAHSTETPEVEISTVQLRAVP